MKILTWNINGIRASKVPLKQLFDHLDADIICLQETKVTRDMLEERTAIVDGYSSYYSFSNVRTGYSGVATYVKDSHTPVRAEQGLSGCMTTDDDGTIGCYGDQTDFTDEEMALLDKEGRSVITQHALIDNGGKECLLTVINVYCPRADPEREDRLAFKLRFYKLLQIRAEAILNSNSHVIILGDVNMAHRRIDRCDPVEPEEFNKNPGRIWLDELIWAPECNNDEATNVHKSNVNDRNRQISVQSALPVSSVSAEQLRSGCSKRQFVDTFRYFHPGQTEKYTCWNTMIGARETNFGSRIDYILADVPLTTKYFTTCEILADVMGSDHCPVWARINCELKGARKCPQLCTKYFPEFVGLQTKLSAFFTKGVKRPCDDDSKSRPDTGQLVPSQSNKMISTIALNMSKSNSFPPASKSKQMKLGNLSHAGKKQRSLTSFFSISNNKDSSELSNLKEDNERKDALKRNCEPNADAAMPAEVIAGSNPRLLQGTSSSAWKSLLKGPPPAPLCKGHGEACLLRTVKKGDSLNKGRQFYVCPRPEGLKTNPQARCEHFQWVDKKRKLKS